MRFQVANELRQPVGTRSHYEIRERKVSLADDICLGELSASVEFLRTDKSLLVSARVMCTARGECSRCLRELDYPITLEFQEEYLPTYDVVTGLPIAIPGDVDNFLIDAEFVLDLGEAIRQYVVIAEPLNPLCTSQCRGLCPGCGHNLNNGLCACPTASDPRWEALLGLAWSSQEETRS